MIYFLTASKDASIYLQQPKQNTGLDEILEISKMYYGNLKDVSHSLIKFDSNGFSSPITENQIPLTTELENSQSIEANLSGSWNSAVSSSLFYSTSYHSSSVLYNISTGSLEQSASVVQGASASYMYYATSSVVGPVESFITASESVATLYESIYGGDGTGNLYSTWVSASAYESLISESFYTISASYANNLISSSIDDSYVDIELSDLFNNILITSASSYSQSLYYSESYNSNSASLYNQISELNILENYISESVYFTSTELLELSASYYTATIDYLLASASVIDVLEITTNLSSSWNEFVSQSNFYSESYAEYSDSLNNRIINSEFDFQYECHLILKECESNEIPLSYTIYAHPVSQSWEMGIGTRFDDITTDGVTWNSITTGHNWLESDSLVDGSTGSFNGKGGTWYTSSVATQSFEYQSSDIEMNITDMVNSWLSDEFPNDGIILKHDSVLENDTTDYGQLKFFSKETNTIYQPKLRIGWDDSSFETGSLSELTADDIHVTFKRLKTKYRKGSKPEIRVFGREKYPLKHYGNQYAYNDVTYLPSTTYYQIKDVITDEVIIPFSDYTKVSCDSNGNFFKLNLSNWETNREYYIEIQVDRDGIIEYFSDKDLTFTVEK